MIAFATGFMVFHILEKAALIRHTPGTEYAEHRHPQVGVISSLALIAHSFIDGASIAIGFQIDQSLGLLIAIAVISHDFTDGMNTVALMLSNNNPAKIAKLFLLFDSLAPFLGFLSIFFIKFPLRL